MPLLPKAALPLSPAVPPLAAAAAPPLVAPALLTAPALPPLPSPPALHASGTAPASASPPTELVAVPQPIPARIQTGHLLTTKTQVVIGAGQVTDNGFTGKMDELRFWSVARTATQIAESYQVILKGDEPGLIAYYHFDDGTGTTVKDASAKHHDATFDSSAGRPAPTWVDATELTLICAP